MITVPDRRSSEMLLAEYVKSDNLREHCYMVAKAMEKSAEAAGVEESERELWWTAGLLHDLDWEQYPEQHPHQATSQILPPLGYPQIVIDAILAHAPERTGREPVTSLECNLFACDELSGFMKAVSLMRPNGFTDMEPKSVIKKMKDKRFAATVSRSDIRKGADLVNRDLAEQISFLIEVFS
ncbi:MAG: HDIG domain-containing protein [Balneolaceae bacterium]|nr:MAG: HDIG domain-containing protein [Balneolaceae bacterium]